MAIDRMKNPDPSKKLHPQIQEKIDYIASPIYKRRLLGLGQPKDTVDKLISDRINALKNTKIVYNSDIPGDALALTDIEGDYPIIKMRNQDNPKYLSGSALAHEIGHATSGLYERSGFESSPNYKPVANYDGSNFNYSKSRKLFNDIISSGSTTAMSPKEKLFFDLQNKAANYVAPKGSGIYKLTGGTSLNDYYYNSKNYKEDWPLGTHVDLSEQKEPMYFANFKNSNSPVNERKTLPSLDLMKNSEYNEEFLRKSHGLHIDKQGIQQSHMNTSGNPFAGGLLSHTYSSFENKGDLDGVRHLLKKYNYTKKFGDDITPELLEKASKDKRINTDEQFQRMKENFNDKEIINLNNRVAYNNILPTKITPLQSMKDTDYSS
jgi:hypothetical protein